MDKLKIFECFSGVGSQRMALRNINVNYESVGISEVDKYAILAYNAIHEEQIDIPIVTKSEMLNYMKSQNIAYNFSTMKNEMPTKDYDIKKLYEATVRSKNYGDITKINTDNLPDFDFLTYTFPCKNISVAGKQGGLEKNSNTQSSLVWECERIIKNKKPKYLMMENVKNIIGKNHIEDFNDWIKTLELLGYKNYYSLLNGKDYRVPQNRERVIMISIREDILQKFEFPQKQKLKKHVKDLLTNNVSEKYTLNINQFVSFNKIDANTTDNLRQIGFLDKKGSESNRRIYSIKGICPTLNSMNGGNREPKFLINNNYIRKLTALECWRMMGFSDNDFYKAKDVAHLPDSKLYERAGRGIIVPMLEDIFKILFEDYIIK